MASLIANLVQQTTTSTGTGNLTLVANTNGYNNFSTAFGTGVTTNVFYYFITNLAATEYEFGTGHMSASTTLVRDTVIQSSNANAAVNFSAGTKMVVNSIPQSLLTLLETTTGSGAIVLTNTPTITTPVLNGIPTGTGVSTSATINTLVLRDGNGNAFANNFVSGYTSTVSAAGTTSLTPSSNRSQELTGTTTQTYKMPNGNASGMNNGFTWYFNNNSTGIATITDHGGTTITTVPAGGMAIVVLKDNSTSNGTWDYHFFLPANASYGTAGLTVTGTFTMKGNYSEYGPTTYPVSSYPSGNNFYLVLDKAATASDSSLVLRDQGNARAEIGLIGDNNIHIKTVTGTYGSETFTDRIIINNSTGNVDVYNGGLLRNYATSGTPTIIAGNSDGSSSGAGLELIYDQTNTQAIINSIERGNTYRKLLIQSNGIDFYLGGASVSKLASLSSTGAFTAVSSTVNLNLTNNNAVTVTTNAGTCSASYSLNTFTNSSAAAMTITISTSGAVDGQRMLVRIYDFSNVSQSISWVGTENSNVTAPTTSNGSTTLPLTVGFQYNASTSKWRCLAYA